MFNHGHLFHQGVGSPYQSASTMERSISYNHLPSRPEHSWQEYSHAHTKSAADKNGNAARNTPQQRSSMPQQRPTSVAGTTVMVPNTGQRPPQLLDAIAPSPLDRRSKFAEEEAERLSLEREARKQAAKEAEENKTHLKTRIGARIGPDDEFRGGRYVVRKLLGKGVYGKVFECDDLKYDGCLVAVKIVRDLPEFKAAGLNEIKVLKTLNGACGLLRMCRDFFHFNHVGISVDLYGESLHAKLARVGTFTMAQVADVGLQLLHGVQYMHKCGIVHTDLKPENILMYHRPDPKIGKEDDDVKNPVCIRIVDLGSAVFEKGWHQPEIGTQEYRPPEVVLQTGWSYETDLWAIGCVLVELLTGKKLFFESMDQNVHLMLMEKCLGKKIPQTLLRKAWQSGAARQSKMLVPSTYPTSGHTQLEINPLTKDVLQRKKLREGYLLSEAVSSPLLKDLLDTLLQFEANKRSKAGPLRKHDFFKLARFDRSNIDVLTPYPPIFPPESPLYRPLDSSPTQDRPQDNPQDRTNSFPLDLSGASRSKKEEKIVQMQKLAENFRQQYERNRHSPNDVPGLRPDMPDIQTESLQQAERLLEQLKLQIQENNAYTKRTNMQPFVETARMLEAKLEALCRSPRLKLMDGRTRQKHATELWASAMSLTSTGSHPPDINITPPSSSTLNSLRRESPPMSPMPKVRAATSAYHSIPRM